MTLLLFFIHILSQTITGWYIYFCSVFRRCGSKPRSPDPPLNLKMERFPVFLPGARPFLKGRRPAAADLYLHGAPPDGAVSPS